MTIEEYNKELLNQFFPNAVIPPSREDRVVIHTLSDRSLERLKGVHADLVNVVKFASSNSEIKFEISEGLRSLAKQRSLLASGATQTLNSRHLSGHAIDVYAIIEGEVRWDWPLYSKIADAMKKAAQFLEIPIEWGGDWKTFKDGCHFQLPWNIYPN